MGIIYRDGTALAVPQPVALVIHHHNVLLALLDIIYQESNALLALQTVSATTRYVFLVLQAIISLVTLVWLVFWAVAPATALCACRAPMVIINWKTLANLVQTAAVTAHPLCNVLDAEMDISFWEKPVILVLRTAKSVTQVQSVCCVAMSLSYSMVVATLSIVLPYIHAKLAR
jgi:hypothetical protein